MNKVKKKKSKKTASEPLEEVTIEPNDKTIEESLTVQLGNITVFAGENNSGKTQIVNALADLKKAEEGSNVIQIPAEKVILDNETKASAATDEFYKTLSDLISIAFDSNDLEVSNAISDIGEKLPEIFSEYGVENIDLEVKQGSPTNEEYQKEIKKKIVQKAIEGITIHDTLSKKHGIKLTDAGQGTERLAVVALIMFIAEKKNKQQEETDVSGENEENEKPKETTAYLTIEEPEVYLHPKLKTSFYAALTRLAEKGIKVIITTHDPYFISLSDGEMIYRVSRKSDGSTKIEHINEGGKQKSGHLGYRSNAEINYLVFGLPTVEYALQMYEEFVKGDKNKEKEEVEYDDGSKKKLADMRNEFAHPKEDGVQELPSEQDLKLFIEKIIDIK